MVGLVVAFAVLIPPGTQWFQFTGKLEKNGLIYNLWLAPSILFPSMSKRWLGSSLALNS